MSRPQTGFFQRAWFRWKALELPWRKHFLVGLDLEGNTYWKFRDVRNSSPKDAARWRRIVKYPSSTHYSEVKVPPQWHQWLRHQREHPPSLIEQSEDVARQARIKVLAAEADARWDAKPSLSDMPGRQREQALSAPHTGSLEEPQDWVARGARDRDTTEPLLPDTAGRREDVKEDPWKRASGPSENWQPQSWSPPSSSKRR